jgi:hypothetical protein
MFLLGGCLWRGLDYVRYEWLLLERVLTRSKARVLAKEGLELVDQSLTGLHDLFVIGERHCYLSIEVEW